MSARLRDGIIATARAIGADPLDLATAISYETAGTFDPTKRGPTTQWGQHRGLIQFGEPQARRFGVDWSDPVGSQLGPNGAVANYFRASGFKPGMSGLDLYSTINAGAPGRYKASDANNGGAPGNVRDKWERQMGGHRAKARALLGGAGNDKLAGVMGGLRTRAQAIGTPTPADAPSASMPDMPAPWEHRAHASHTPDGLNIAPEQELGSVAEALLKRRIGGADGNISHPMELAGELFASLGAGVAKRRVTKANEASLQEAIMGAGLSTDDRATAQLAGTREGLIDVLRGRQQREQANAERAHQDQWRRFQAERQMARDGLSDERWNVTRQDRLDRQGVEDQRWNEGQRLQAERWGVEDGRWEQQFGATQANTAADNARADRSLELQEAAAERAAGAPISVGPNTTLLDPATNEPIYTPPVPAPEAPTPTTLQREYAQAVEQGFEGTILDYQQARKGAGFSVTTPDGTVVQQGGPGKLTEGQSKDQLFYRRAATSVGAIDQFADELTNPAYAAASTLGAPGNYMVSEGFQQGQQASREFLAAVLRKDTGAAVTPQEFALYAPMYLPQPGDGEAVIAQKSERRRIFLEGLRKGLGSAEGVVSDVPVPGAAPAPVAAGGQPALAGTANEAAVQQESTALLEKARAAIANGAPREAVIERLRGMGLNPEGL